MRRTVRRFGRVAAIVAALALAATAMVPTPARASDRATYVVQVTRGVDVAGLLGPAVRALGGEVLAVDQHAIHGAVVELPSHALGQLVALPGVASIERDRRISVAQTNPPWGLDRIDQRALPLTKSYTYRTTGRGVDVYVIDTGIRLSHAQVRGRAVTGIDVIDGGAASDCHGHGTHVAGTVGGSTYGVAKAVRLVAVRVLDCRGEGTDSTAIAGISWAIRHHTTRPAVANLSLSGPTSGALDTAIANLVRDGVTVVVAAGNESADACASSPARAKTAITVAASDRNDALASYSNRGSCVDLIAPGSSIVSAGRTSDTATATMSGTSMASPHVAGAAARYLQLRPTASPATVTSALTSTATTGRISGTGQACTLLVLGCIPATPNRLLYVSRTG